MSVRTPQTYRVNLKEIPAEGRDYDFTRKTGELNAILADLIGQRDYDVAIKLKPLGNTYELAGRIRTSIAETCSKCGTDLDVPVSRQVREYLVEDQEEFRNAQSVHGNGAVDFLNEQTSSVTYRSGVFDLGEYIHETVALAEPFYPACPEGQCPDLEEIARKRAELEQSFRKADQTPGHPGFAALKGLKLEDR